MYMYMYVETELHIVIIHNGFFSTTQDTAGDDVFMAGDATSTGTATQDKPCDEQRREGGRDRREGEWV